MFRLIGCKIVFIEKIENRQREAGDGSSKKFRFRPRYQSQSSLSNNSSGASQCDQKLE